MAGIEGGPSTTKGGKFSPDTIVKEQGAVLCRTAPSCLRFSHLELFAMRDEIHELLQLADYICFREYPHLLAVISPANRYIQLYREIANKTAFLVTEWLRVGFVQGNMNSDNTLLSGRTVDYGPYGFLEDYNPFNPKTSFVFSLVVPPFLILFYYSLHPFNLNSLN